MADTNNQKAELETAVRRLVAAEVAHSRRGAGDLDDIPALQNELKLAKARYKTLLDEIFGVPTNG